MVQDHTHHTKRPKLGDLALFELEQVELNLDADDATSNINEARKPQYHDLKREDYADLDTAAGRRRIDQYNAVWLGDLVIAHRRRNHPAVFEYQEEGKTTEYHIAMSAVEAILLGRNWKQFSADEVKETGQVIAGLRRNAPLASQYPEARWPLLEQYCKESVEPKKDANKKLYDASGYRTSNGESVSLASRIELVQEVHLEVLYPTVDLMAKTAGWSDEDRWLLHRIVEWRLFFHGTAKGRHVEWRNWHGTLKRYFEIKYYYFDETVKDEKPEDVKRQARLTGRNRPYAY